MSTESPLKLHPFLMLRTPSFSYLDFDTQQTKERLNDPFFLTAIYLATPAFYQILKAANFDWQLLTDKAKLSLHKYHNRICFRPTPFALFAAFGKLEWQNNDAPPSFNCLDDELHIQFDHQINCALAEKLKTERKEDILWKNPSLHSVDQQFRYVKTIRKIGAKFDFRLAAIDADAILKSIIKKTGKAGISETVLLKEIIKLAICSKEEAADYVHFLITEEILMSNLGPTLIGVPFLAHSFKFPTPHQAKNKLQMQRVLKPLVKASSFNAPLLATHFKKVQHLLPKEDLVDLKTPYYANLERNFEGCLAKQHQESILKTIAVLQKLIPSSNSQNLINFVQKFSKRHEQQKISLLTVLDPEIGLGYGQQEQFNTQNLLDDLPLAGTQTAVSLIWDDAKQLLFKKWLAAEKTGESTNIDISKEDIANLSSKTGVQIPPSLFVMFRLLDEQLFIENTGGISATALAGRFTFFNDEIWKQCRDIALQEQTKQPEVIFADLVQHSAYHTDNINLRQSIYDYEIPINGISMLPVKQQIPLSDLTLQLIGNELVLESITLKRRVIPRLTTAFNAQLNELSIFRFLYDLQSQNLQSNLTLNLEQAFPELNFYPRVTFENTILCLAKWKLVETDIQTLSQSSVKHHKDALNLLKEKLYLPAVIAITRHDHQLVFNLKRDEEIELFISCLQGLKSTWIMEYPFSSAEKNIIKSTAGKPFIGQFIAHLINQERTYSVSHFQESFKTANKRTFIPGDEWLYLKLYCSPTFANKLLAEKIAALIKQLELQNKNIVWFFIRYHDPESHIRLRIKKTGFENLNLSKFFFAELDKLVQNGFIHHIQTDSYIRELERYQLYGMDHVESLFCKSSQLILQFLNKQQRQVDFNVDYHFALYSVSKMITIFIPEPELKLNFLEQMFAKFHKEFSEDKSLNVALDKKYRAQKAEINDVLQHKKYLQIRRLGKTFEQLSNSLKDQKERNKDLSILQKSSLLADLIHMHLNRLFQQDQRQQEMIIYHFLAKYQKSDIAKNKHN